LILGTKNKSAIVTKTLPSVTKIFKSYEPKKDDIIVSINETTVSSAEEFADAYDKFNEGDTVSIVLSRDGKEMKETFSKPKPMGRMIFNRQ